MTFSLHTSTVTFDPKTLERSIRHAQFCLDDPEAFRNCINTLPTAEDRLPLTTAFSTLSQSAQAFRRLVTIIKTGDAHVTMPADDYDSLIQTLATLNTISNIHGYGITPGYR